MSLLSAQPQPGCHGSSQAGLQGQHWYGSEEFLALPDQLRKTEMLALKLENLTHSVPLVSRSKSLEVTLAVFSGQVLANQREIVVIF